MVIIRTIRFYKHTFWDDSDYSYPFLIRKGVFAATPQFTGSSIQWNECRMNKNLKLQLHKLTVISATCTPVECFLMCHSFSEPNRAR